MRTVEFELSLSAVLRCHFLDDAEAHRADAMNALSYASPQPSSAFDAAVGERALQHGDWSHVQPRTRNRITKIGMGIPISHSNPQPRAPA
jgi:hypothetical protein